MHRRDEVWGDEPEERDAAATIEQFSSDAGIQRKLAEHPRWIPAEVVWRFIRKSGKRIGVTIAGFLLLIVAAVIIPVPGPWSILLTIVALSILGTEYVWARRLLKFAKEKAEQAKSAVFGKKDPAPSPPEESSP